ncbi:MAG: hypothetical protein IT167_26255 [Bryobacterales bacterium]|nr:hypothetical protein [Bryobacterales bacterium]
MPDTSDELNSRMGDLMRLIGALAALDPLEAETNARNAGALQKLMERGRGALRFSTPAGAVYLVVEHGTRYTTKERPPMDEGEIDNVGSEGVKPVLWPAVLAHASWIREHAPKLLEESGLLDAMRSLSRYYDADRMRPREAVEGSLDETAIRLLSQAPPPRDPARAPDSEILDYAWKLEDRLSLGYGRFLLPGYYVARQLAALALFHTCPYNLSSVYRLSLEAVAPVAEKGRKKRTAVIPALDPSFYLEHSYFEGEPVREWALHAARGMRARGEGRLRRAKESATMGAFLAYVQGALVYFLSAAILYRKAGAEREWAVMEEHRVVLGNSLLENAHACGGSPRFTKLGDFARWMDHLETLEEAEAKREVYEMEMQIRIPLLLRHTALTILDLRRAPGRGEAARRLEGLAMRLEAELAKEEVLAGEPNFLGFVYLELSKAAHAAGDEEQARAYEEKATASTEALR